MIRSIVWPSGNDAEAVITTKTGFGDLVHPVALHSWSQFWTTGCDGQSVKVKLEQQVEIAQWNFMFQTLLCMNCNGRIIDKAWHGGESTAEADCLPPCVCTNGCNLLIWPLGLGKKTELLRRSNDGTTSLYVQVPRERDWKSLNVHRASPQAPWILAVKVTEIEWRNGEVVSSTIFSGHVRLGGHSSKVGVSAELMVKQNDGMPLKQK